MPSKLTQEIKDKITAEYPDLSSFKIMSDLLGEGIIDENENLLGADAYTKLKSRYPNAFPTGVKPNKIKVDNGAKKTSKMRVGKFDELKALWDMINQKAILEYKIASEDDFLELFVVLQVDGALPQRLDLGAGQLDAGLQRFLDKVFVIGFFVCGDHPFARHPPRPLPLLSVHAGRGCSPPRLSRNQSAFLLFPSRRGRDC